MTFKILLSPWSFENQLTSPTVDGSPPAARFNECGETCVSMVLKYKTDRLISPDLIKDEIYGAAYTGIGYNMDLISYLNATPPAGKYYTNTVSVKAAMTPPPQIVTPINGPGSLLNIEWNYLVNGNPLIALFYYDYPGNTLLHWRAVIGMEENSSGRYVYTADPITGYMKTETYEQHVAMSKNLVVGIGQPKYPVMASKPLFTMNNLGNDQRLIDQATRAMVEHYK